MSRGMRHRVGIKTVTGTSRSTGGVVTETTSTAWGPGRCTTPTQADRNALADVAATILLPYWRTPAEYDELVVSGAGTFLDGTYKIGSVVATARHRRCLCTRLVTSGVSS